MHRQSAYADIKWGRCVVDLTFLTLLWLTAVMVVGPGGDFPLNDDWSFGLAAQRMADTGVFEPTGWTSMPLITHTLWGALFSSLFGSSFDVLRMSTLVLSLGGVFGMYFLTSMVSASRGGGHHRGAGMRVQPSLFRAVFYVHD